METIPEVPEPQSGSFSASHSLAVPKQEPRSRARLISVEPAILLILAVQGVFVNLRTQYVEARLAAGYNYTLPEAGNCSLANISGDATGKRIESETSLWVMYMKSVSVFVPIFTGTLLIAASDFVGRKPILIINALGHLLAASMFLLIVWLSLPLVVAVAAECILGISGDSIVTMNVAYAYIADTTQGKSRVMKLMILAFLIYVGFGASQIIVDVILRSTGNYLIAFGIAWLCALINILYVSIPGVLLETVPRTTFRLVQTVKNLLKGYASILAVKGERRRSRVVLILTIAMLGTLINEGIYAVITIYGIGPPFCWAPTMVGIYNVIVNAFPALVSLILIKPLLFCMPSYCIMQLGFLSGVAILIVTARATTNLVLVYAAVAAGCLRVIPDVIEEDILSKLVSKDQQGIAFSVLSLVVSVGKVLSPIIFNDVYAAAVLKGIPEVTFYVAAAIYILPVILTCILQMCSRPFESKTVLHIQEDGQHEEEQNLLEDE